MFSGGALMYLDYDGLLHNENVRIGPDGEPFLQAPERYRLFQHVDLLQELLAPYPAVQIVLSTTWAARFGIERAASYLPDGLRRRVVGATAWDHGIEVFLRLPRPEQIAQDLARRRPAAWLAVDDDLRDWPDWMRPHVVFSHPYEGISPPTVQDAIRARLAEMAQKTGSQA
jgi:hypothetical protein